MCIEVLKWEGSKTINIIEGSKIIYFPYFFSLESSTLGGNHYSLQNEDIFLHTLDIVKARGGGAISKIRFLLFHS